jgi:hypothetical protein
MRSLCAKALVARESAATLVQNRRVFLVIFIYSFLAESPTGQ